MKSQLDTSLIAVLEVLGVMLSLKRDQSAILGHNQVILQVYDPLRTQIEVIITICCHLLFNWVKRVSPFFGGIKAELVCNLAMHFYCHLIQYLVYFQAVNQENDLNTFEAKMNYISRTWQKLGKITHLILWTDLMDQMTSKLHETCFIGKDTS